MAPQKTRVMNEKWQPKNGYNDSGVYHFPSYHKSWYVETELYSVFIINDNILL